MSTRTRMVDDGTISPKVAIPTAVLAFAGVVAFILDSTGVVDMDDSLWITLLSAGGVTFTGGYAARPGAVIPDPPDRDELRVHVSGDSGYTLVEMAFALLIIVIAVVIAVHFL
jgi:prepilin-type N-terminal cleavage/methylation domain-containing protein